MKKVAIKPENNDHKCFQCVTTVALNYKLIKSHVRIISKIKPSISKYNWIEINFSSHKNDWKKFETNNKTIAYNILLVPYSFKQI